MVMGLPGSGKSYFASRLAAAMHADYLSSDKLRKTIIAKRSYSPKEKELVYDEMLTKMKQAVKQNKNVVLDATFYKNVLRNKFTDEVAGTDSILFIEITAAEPLIKERLSRKRGDSEADFEVYKIIREEWEPLRAPHLILESTNDNLDTMLDMAITYLHKKNDKGTD